jgi:hypothetical protein
MHFDQSRLEHEFQHQGAITAKDLASFLGVSQPTVSRLLARDEGRRILHLGRGRRSRYAATRDVFNLGSSWPLYEIDREGRAQSLGQLHALMGRQWCLQQSTPWESLRGRDFQDGLYPGFPWFEDAAFLSPPDLTGLGSMAGVVWFPYRLWMQPFSANSRPPGRRRLSDCSGEGG